MILRQPRPTFLPPSTVPRSTAARHRPEPRALGGAIPPLGERASTITCEKRTPVPASPKERVTDSWGMWREVAQALAGIAGGIREVGNRAPDPDCPSPLTPQLLRRPPEATDGKQTGTKALGAFPFARLPGRSKEGEFSEVRSACPVTGTRSWLPGDSGDFLH